MTKPHLSRVGDLDPRSTTVDFSPEVRSAFRDLAAAVHFSDHFDPLMLQTVQAWAETQKPSVHDVVTALPILASETFKHIQATGDKAVERIWGNIGSELLEKGFTLQKNRWRGK